jgi:hypothetical protein
MRSQSGILATTLHQFGKLSRRNERKSQKITLPVVCLCRSTSLGGVLKSDLALIKTGSTMLLEKLTISANNQEEEPYRLDRLNKVIGYICALAEHYGNRDLLNKIWRLHDHKGHLTVYWEYQPTPGEKEILLKAWESDIGDSPCDGSNVEHILGKPPKDI